MTDSIKRRKVWSKRVFLDRATLPEKYLLDQRISRKRFFNACTQIYFPDNLEVPSIRSGDDPKLKWSVICDLRIIFSLMIRNPWSGSFWCPWSVIPNSDHFSPWFESFADHGEKFVSLLIIWIYDPWSAIRGLNFNALRINVNDLLHLGLNFNDPWYVIRKNNPRITSFFIIGDPWSTDHFLTRDPWFGSF